MKVITRLDTRFVYLILVFKLSIASIIGCSFYFYIIISTSAE